MLVIALTCVAAMAAFIQPQQAPRWKMIEELKLGSSHDSRIVFERIGSATLVNGNLWVADTKAREILIIDRDGVLKKRIGKRGKGPGEFEIPTSLGMVGDSIWVFDPGLGRFTLYSPSAKLIRTVTLQHYTPRDAAFGPAAPSALLVDGNAVVFPSPKNSEDFRRPNVRRPVIIVNQDGRYAEQLATIRLGRAVSVPRPGMKLSTPAYNDGGFASIIPGGLGIIIVDQPSANKGAEKPIVTISEYHANTRLVRRWTFPFTPVRFPPHFRDSVEKAIVKSTEAMPSRPTKAEIQKILPNIDYLPTVTAIRTGTDGSTWIRREDGDRMQLWTIVKAGRVIGEAQLPRGAMVLAATDKFAWVRQIGAWEEDHLVKYRIAK